MTRARMEMDIIMRLEAPRNLTLRYFDLSDEQLDRNYGLTARELCGLTHF